MIVAVNVEFPDAGSAKFWSFYNEAPEIFAIKNSTNYSIDLLPSIDESSVVVIGIKAGLAADYTLDATGVDNFFVAKSIILEDLKTGSMQELKDNPSYTFMANPGDAPERFLLHFGGPFGIGSKGKQPGFTIYSFGNSVYVKNVSGRNLDGIIYICNILGQKIYQQKIVGQMAKVDLTAPAGCYIVTLVICNQTYSKQVFIH